MSDTPRVVDFFVEPLPRNAGATRDWGVFKESLSQRVGIDDNPADATAHATRMAQYLVSRGCPAQIHVRDEIDAPWCTIWSRPRAAAHSPGS